MKKLLHITISGFVLLCFNGCGWGWFVPYSFQPSYHKFKKMCKMEYDFIFKGMGNVEAIHTYRVKNGFTYGVWYNGRYEPAGHLGDLHFEKQWINCNCFYKKWDKKYLSEEEWDKKYIDSRVLKLKALKELIEEEKNGIIELNNINKIKRQVRKLEKSMKNKDLNIAK